MKRPSWLSTLPRLCVLLLLAVMSHFCLLGTAQEKQEEKNTVQARDLVLTVPKTWQQEEPMSRLRLTQFRIPAVDGDDEDGEMMVFSFGGGGDIEANIRRWIGQFQAEQRQVRIAGGDAPQGKYVLVDVSGTYNKPDGPPALGKTKPVPGYRAVSVILVIEKKGVYFLKFVGPQKTLAAHMTAYRDAFGAPPPDQEKVYTDPESKEEKEEKDSG